MKLILVYANVIYFYKKPIIIMINDMQLGVTGNVILNANGEREPNFVFIGFDASGNEQTFLDVSIEIDVVGVCSLVSQIYCKSMAI